MFGWPHSGTDNLELVGRGLADAAWPGRHSSRLRGAGVDFHSHRAYTAGDDLRRVNWALFARHRRVFTRESRHESRRPVYLLLDTTGSMATAHGRYSKYHLAARIAAGMAHLAISQGDAPALGLLGSRLEAVRPSRTGARHLTSICAGLSAAAPAGEGDLSRALTEVRALCRRRGFIILISDFFDKEDIMVRELSALRAQGHDVLALQILDPLEAELPATGDFDFIDLESGARLKASADALRDTHRAVVADWRENLRTACTTGGIRWETTTTSDPIVPLLQRWLR